MKKTILWSALFTLLCSQVQAEGAAPVNSQSTNQPSPVQNATTDIAPATDLLQPVPQATIINCEYTISNTTKTVDKPVVLSWSESAALQAFSFASTNLDAQMKSLQSCFTEQGWVGFNNALQKSGNMEAIKSQNLTMMSKIDGQTQLTEIKENQWKLTVPLQVVYQNDKEKVTQLLNIDLTIGRKSTGNLGIMQIIATPRPQTQQQTTSSNTSDSQDNSVASFNDDYSNDDRQSTHIETTSPEAMDSGSQGMMNQTAGFDANE